MFILETCDKATIETVEGTEITKGQKDSYVHNDIVILKCKDNKVVTGNTHLKCNFGKWSSSMPTCIG